MRLVIPIGPLDITLGVQRRRTRLLQEVLSAQAKARFHDVNLATPVAKLSRDTRPPVDERFRDPAFWLQHPLRQWAMGRIQRTEEDQDRCDTGIA